MRGGKVRGGKAKEDLEKWVLVNKT